MDVRYVARLARLRLSEDEVACFGPQLDHVLDYIRQLEEVPVEGVEPTAHAQSLQNVFREDEPRAGLDRAPVLGNAPGVRDHQFVVPRMVE